MIYPKVTINIHMTFNYFFQPIALAWLWSANMLLIKTDPREVLSCGIFYSIIMGSTILSNLYLASMSIDRSLMILSPATYRLTVTQSRVIIRIILICLITSLFLIPHHFYLYYDPKNTLFLCDFYSFVKHRQIRLWSYAHASFFVAIPLLIVCISSYILLHNRCKHNRIYKQNISKSARRMYRLSIFLFSVSIGIFVCVLPICILEIFIVHDRYFNHKACLKRWVIYRILLNCFLTLSSINYSMKFYINIIISTPMRKNFIQLIRCKFNQNTSESAIISNEQCLLSLRSQNKTKSTEK